MVLLRTCRGEGFRAVPCGGQPLNLNRYGVGRSEMSALEQNLCFLLNIQMQFHDNPKLNSIIEDYSEFWDECRRRKFSLSLHLNFMTSETSFLFSQAQPSWTGQCELTCFGVGAG